MISLSSNMNCTLSLLCLQLELLVSLGPDSRLGLCGPAHDLGDPAAVAYGPPIIPVW